jgi:hypothetical protein
MSRWNHAICDPCWEAREPTRTPVRRTIPQEEVCCYCGARTTSGIYVRDDPDLVPCAGVHPDHLQAATEAP